MDQPPFVVLLAGRIRSTPLIDAINVPALCLPIGKTGTLFDAWLHKLAALGGVSGVRAVVNTDSEAKAVKLIVRGLHRRCFASQFDIDVVPEPAPWRGAGGILRDVTEQLPRDVPVLVCEANCLPPERLDPLISVARDNHVVGVIGVCGEDQPAGAYLFSRAVIDSIPAIGYFDLKEQFLPGLGSRNERVLAARLGDCGWRLHDRESYLECVRRSLNSSDSNSRNRISTRASVSPSAILDGCCIVEAGAVIEDGAVIHDSVVLWGATVGGGAVVSRSVVGSLAVVHPRERVADRAITRPSSWENDLSQNRWIQNLERSSL